MNQQLRALFNEPVGEGYAIDELDQQIEFINKTFGNEIKSEQVDLYMKDNFGLKVYLLLKSLYHFDQLKTLNWNKYSDSKFKQLLIFAQMQLNRISLINNELEQRYIFVIGIKIGIKYYGLSRKLITGFISSLLGNYREQTELLDALLQQLIEELYNPSVPALFLLGQVLNLVFELRILDDQLKLIISKIFQILNIDFSTLSNEFGIVMWNILILIIKKIEKNDSKILLEIANDIQFLKFAQFYMFKNEDSREDLLMSLRIILRTYNESDAPPLTTPPPFSQIVLTLLPIIMQTLTQDDLLSDEQKIEELLFVSEAVKYRYAYDYFVQNFKPIFTKIIIPNLVFSEDEINEYHDNPSEFFELVQCIVRQDEESLKGVLSKLAVELAQYIDGSIKFMFSLSLELILYQLNKIQDTPMCNSLNPELLDDPFFTQQLYEDRRYSTLLLVMIILHDNILKRRDLKHQMEAFLKQNLKGMKNQDGIGKCLGIELIKVLLPSTFKQMEGAFKNCIKFTFKLLNKSCQKRCIKLFAIESLKFLIEDDDSRDRFDEVLVEFGMDICDQISKSDIEAYYQFVQTVLENCNMVVDNYLDRIMQALYKRIVLGINKGKNQVVNHASIIYLCITLIDTILSMNYCLKLTPQIEPYLLDVTKLLLHNASFESGQFADEIFDADARFIKHTKGLTELLYMIFEKIPQLFQENKLSINSVFKFFLYSMIYGGEVLKSKPQFLQTILQYLHSIILLNQSSNDQIKTCILLQVAYQYFDLSSIAMELTQNLTQVLSRQINDKDVQAKVYISIFMPVIMDISKIQQYGQILFQSSGFLNIAFSTPLTLYNYRMLFLIFAILITQSHILYEEQSRITVLEQLFSMFLNRYANYIDKITFKQQMGQTDILQKITNKANNQTNFDIDFDEQTIDVHLKSMGIFKQEEKIENPIQEDLNRLPLMNPEYSKMAASQIVRYLNQNYPQILNKLNQADRILLNQISQMQVIENTENGNELRQVYKASKRKQVQGPKQQFNAM